MEEEGLGWLSINFFIKSLEPALECVDYERSIKTTEQKQALLDKINSRRNKIASGEVRSFPAADNMLKLVSY